MTYTVQRRWVSKLTPSPGWRWVPEHEGLTLTRARLVVANDRCWQRCGLQQRIVNSAGRVLRTFRSRITSPAQQDRIRRTHLPELYL